MLHLLSLPLALLCLAIGLILSHRQAWQARKDEPDEAERRFFRVQYRRRMQTSAMLIVVAVLMAAGMTVPRQQYPTAFVGCWLAAMVTLLWMLLLAGADVVANRGRAARLGREEIIARAKLEAERRRLEPRK